MVLTTGCFLAACVSQAPVTYLPPITTQMMHDSKYYSSFQWQARFEQHQNSRLEMMKNAADWGNATEKYPANQSDADPDNEVQSEVIRDGEKTNTRHSALAQVIANQYGFDLSSVKPSSKGPGSKITAADVEYHAWKISQPPCTLEALEEAYSLGLNLNDLYDDEDRQYVMQMADVQLYVENLRSLRMTSQVKKRDLAANTPKKRARKMNAIDKRVEQNMEKLTYKAMQVAMTLSDGIVRRVQSQLQQSTMNLHARSSIADMAGNKVTDEITTVADFDVALANEIQEALSIAEKSSKERFQLDDCQSNNSRDDIEGGYNMEDLQNMTCMQLKEELRQRGMKLSGKKADLVDRLFYWADPVAAQNDSSIT